MVDAITGLELKSVYPVGQRARLAVVYVAGCINDYDHVVVKVSRVVNRDVSCSTDSCCRQCSYLSGTDLPRSWPNKLFTWYACVGFNQCGQVKIGDEANFLGVEPPIVFKRERHSNLFSRGAR